MSTDIREEALGQRSEFHLPWQLYRWIAGVWFAMLMVVVTESVISTMKPAIHHLLLLLIFEVFYASCKGTWCYDKPSCGPKTWGSIGYCNGKQQSPINIVTKDVPSNPCLGPLTFTGYEDRGRPKILRNDGHSAKIEMKSGASISSAGLPATYYLQSFHFHWGTFNHRGSEHAINGLHYLMEMHLVHTKDGMSMEKAGRDPQGIAVVTFFIKKSKKSTSVTSWKTLADLLQTIPEKNNSVELNGEFSLGSLLSLADLSTYYQYHGSLTTPDCNEAVMWIIYPEPILVSHSVAKKFTNSLYYTTVEENRKMQKNYRPLQPRNNREVLCFQEQEYMHYKDYCAAQKKV